MYAGLFARSGGFWERDRMKDQTGNCLSMEEKSPSIGCKQKRCPKQGGQENVLNLIRYIQTVSLPTQQKIVFKGKFTLTFVS